MNDETSQAADEKAEQQDAVVTVPSDSSIQATQEKQAENFSSRLSEKNHNDEKTAETKKPAGPKLKLFEIVGVAL